MDNKTDVNKLNANKVIDKLTQQIAGMSKEMAMLYVQMDNLQNVIDKQKEYIDAYEEKENAKK